VIIVVLENANYASVAGSAVMPYLNSLVPQGALLTNYFADVHPSLGDYFMMTLGSIPNADDNFPGPVSGDNVTTVLAAAGKTWKEYAENLPARGYVGGDVMPYLRRHNPFAYMANVQLDPAQAANIVPFPLFAADLAAGTLPHYAFVSPNAWHDAHTCPGAGTGSACTQDQKLAAADAWLQANLAPILANSTLMSQSLVVITFDESADDLQNGGGQVFTLMLGSHVRPGFRSTTLYQHASLLRVSMDVLSVTAPGAGATAPQMLEIFQ
jgi:acid phosphatase